MDVLLTKKPDCGADLCADPVFILLNKLPPEGRFAKYVVAYIIKTPSR